MPDKDRRREASGEVKPAQIPLLEDVVEPPAPKPKRRRRRKEDYALDLDPDPPLTRDLFPADDKTRPAATSERPQHLRWPSSTGEDAKQPSAPADSTAEAPEAAEGKAVEDARQQLRARADRVVDDLVQEYSEEIIRRLREELTTLLDQLGKDVDPRH